MTITSAIRQLTHLLEKHGDVEVMMDCPYCHKSAAPDHVVAIATLQHQGAPTPTVMTIHVREKEET